MVGEVEVLVDEVTVMMVYVCRLRIAMVKKEEE